MYGLVFEKVECFVIDQFGEAAWHAIKEQADCHIPDGQFLRRSLYKDEQLVNLVVAAAEYSQTPVATVLEAFGHSWYRQMYDNDGHATLLKSNGKTLRTWLSNLNAMHDHIQRSFGKEEFNTPIFWCEDCVEQGGDILLHYYSVREALLVPFVEGIVKEIATSQFNVEISVEAIAVQGQEGATFTTWRVSAVDPSQRYKLSPQNGETEEETTHLNGDGMTACPFTGKQLTNGQGEEPKEFHNSSTCLLPPSLSMSLTHLQSLFPFHILVDNDFIILQVGSQITSLLTMKMDDNGSDNNKSVLVGKHIGEVLQIARPVLGTAWDWKALQKLADQHFFMTPVSNDRKNGNKNKHASSSDWTASSSTLVAANKDEDAKRRKSSLRLKKKVSMQDTTVKFRASMVEIPLSQHSVHDDDDNPAQNHLVMFSLAPDAGSVGELQSMGLTIPDLPLHSSQRDAVFLGEYIEQEMNRAHELDKLSKQLKKEKDLSNTLLYNMLPRSIADDLRNGQTVEPLQHDNVTLFFSDIVGFTNICAQVDPWAVIDMLNQLYSVMDHLAAKFNLYKVETIGDAYMCCCGLPIPNDLHAENIANFAIAVMECVKHVKSPVDNVSPINLRIGVHTGHCTAGVVGTLTPHYCLFGDMVNVTARHEQTGVAGRIQCSSDVFGKLQHFSTYTSEQYRWTPRGLVDMKGKGERYTYFLEGGTDDNSQASPSAVDELYEEVGAMLEKNRWKKRRYFRKSGALGGSIREDGSEMDSSEMEDSTRRGHVLDSLADDLSNSDAGGNSGSDAVAGSDGGSNCMDDSEGEEKSNKLDVGQSKPKNGLVQLVQLVWSDTLSREDYVSVIHQVVSPLLQDCLRHTGKGKLPETAELLDGQLFGFVNHISMSFRARNAFHNFCHSAHVVAWANHLFESVQRNVSKSHPVDDNPWFRLTLILAALIRDCKHSGVPGEQLQAEGHMVCVLYGEDASCQVKYAVSHAMNAMEENFNDLFRELNKSFPSFLYLLRQIAVCKAPLEAFDVAMAPANSEDGITSERAQAAAALVLKLASVGHFALDEASFISWTKKAMAERRIASLAGRGPDPGPNWRDDCERVAEKEVLPLVRRYETLLSTKTGLRDTVLRNLQIFR